MLLYATRRKSICQIRFLPNKRPLNVSVSCAVNLKTIIADEIMLSYLCTLQNIYHEFVHGYFATKLMAVISDSNRNLRVLLYMIQAVHSLMFVTRIAAKQLIQRFASLKTSLRLLSMYGNTENESSDDDDYGNGDSGFALYDDGD